MDDKNSNGRGAAARPSGLIIRQKGPDNLEMPFDQLNDFITPSELFYIRSHFPVPELDVRSYRLSIRGAVQRKLNLTYDDIRALPSRTCIATLECAGNGRVFLVPPVPGAQWELGAVGNAEWTGVPLSVLLEHAGLDEDVCEVVLEGADRGIPKEEPKPPGAISYAGSIPRKRALDPDVLVAYAMNGKELPRDHGYPLRAVVPGHYGMASVKWLTDVIATTQPFQGYWQTSDYGYWDASTGTPVRRPLAEMKLKAQIARPRVYETLEPNRPYTIFGAAWAGNDRRGRDLDQPRCRRIVGPRRVHRPNQSERLATLEIRLDHADAPWPLYSYGARQGCRSKPSTRRSRCELWYVCDRPSPADRSLGRRPVATVQSKMNARA
jgi:DMSO/TMAO reductase YedYZ molybdopterin-dependent catalytic subunit